MDELCLHVQQIAVLLEDLAEVGWMLTGTTVIPRAGHTTATPHTTQPRAKIAGGDCAGLLQAPLCAVGLWRLKVVATLI